MAQEINISSAQTQYDQRSKKAEEIRSKHGDNTLVLFEVGDFHECYGASARQLAQATGVTLSMRGNTEIAAFPNQAKDTYFPRLVRKGYKLCIYTKGSF